MGYDYHSVPFHESSSYEFRETLLNCVKEKGQVIGYKDTQNSGPFILSGLLHLFFGVLNNETDRTGTKLVKYIFRITK